MKKTMKKTESGKILDINTGELYAGDGKTLLKVPIKKINQGGINGETKR